MREARLTRRQALGVAGAGALALALPEPLRLAAQSLEGGLQPELVTVTQRGFAAWWCTDAPADTTVRIARADGRGGVRELPLDGPRTVHAARLDGLRPDTDYRYELRSGGRSMQQSSANPGHFRTLPLLEGERLATIAVLNDMHVGEQCSGTITSVGGDSVPPCFSAPDYAYRMSDAALSDIAELRPDLVVANGDLTDRGRPGEVSRALELLGSSGRPVLVTRGNHDRRLHDGGCGKDGDCLRRDAFPERAPGEHALTSVSRVGDRVAVVGLDSCDPETGEGRLDLGGQLAWLDGTLNDLRTEGRIALVCFHHHVATAANSTHPPPLFFGVSPARGGLDALRTIGSHDVRSCSTATRTATTWRATRWRRGPGSSRTEPRRSTLPGTRCSTCTRTGSCAPSTGPSPTSRASGRARRQARSGGGGQGDPAPSLFGPFGVPSS